MSKAFVKELEEAEDTPEPSHAPPHDFKNYMTPQGTVNFSGSYKRCFG